MAAPGELSAAPSGRPNQDWRHASCAPSAALAAPVRAGPGSLVPGPNMRASGTSSASAASARAGADPVPFLPAAEPRLRVPPSSGVS